MSLATRTSDERERETAATSTEDPLPENSCQMGRAVELSLLSSDNGHITFNRRQEGVARVRSGSSAVPVTNGKDDKRLLSREVAMYRTSSSSPTSSMALKMWTKIGDMNDLNGAMSSLIGQRRYDSVFIIVGCRLDSGGDRCFSRSRRSRRGEYAADRGERAFTPLSTFRFRGVPGMRYDDVDPAREGEGQEEDIISSAPPIDEADEEGLLSALSRVVT